ncbi:hypothetical protein I3843_04G068000 [Carya illinoinensis]|nr:hypothetical protein I3843_04G068000 [Carya illinoinensis]KAG7982737.1 hypothetical protein I3843_04G068000 [Carya illinoinensis]KAG7982738.1 hypothetical protein I3843_04G068000 [Carya illinoinensis]
MWTTSRIGTCWTQDNAVWDGPRDKVVVYQAAKCILVATFWLMHGWTKMYV